MQDCMAYNIGISWKQQLSHLFNFIKNSWTLCALLALNPWNVKNQNGKINYQSSVDLHDTLKLVGHYTQVVQRHSVHSVLKKVKV